MPTPYGLTNFLIDYPSGSIELEPSANQIYTEKEEDVIDTEIHSSPFSGKNWAVSMRNYRRWTLEMINSTTAQWTTAESLKNI
jgi:hypothetical protein